MNVAIRVYRQQESRVKRETSRWKLPGRRVDGERGKGSKGAAARWDGVGRKTRRGRRRGRFYSRERTDLNVVTICSQAGMWSAARYGRWERVLATGKRERERVGLWRGTPPSSPLPVALVQTPSQPGSQRSWILNQRDRLSANNHPRPWRRAPLASLASNRRPRSQQGQTGKPTGAPRAHAECLCRSLL